MERIHNYKEIGEIMGKTCCTGRSKAASFPRTAEAQHSQSKPRKQSYLEEVGDPSAAWCLQGSNDLKYDLRGVFTATEEADISLVLQRYEAVGRETAKAIADCYELSVAGQREARKVVISSEAVYFCNAEHLPHVKHRVVLKDLFLVSLAENGASAMLHSSAALSDVWLTGSQTGDILQAIQKHRYELTRLYVPCDMAIQRGSLRYRLNNVPSALRAFAQSESALLATAVIVRFGTFGEYCCLTQTCSTERDHRRRKCIFLLTNKAIYTLTAGKVERLALAEVTTVKVVGTQVCAGVGEVERRWTLPASIQVEISKLLNRPSV